MSFWFPKQFMLQKRAVWMYSSYIRNIRHLCFQSYFLARKLQLINRKQQVINIEMPLHLTVGSTLQQYPGRLQLYTVHLLPFSFSLFCQSISHYQNLWMVRMEISCTSIFRVAQYPLYLSLPASDRHHRTQSLLLAHNVGSTLQDQNLADQFRKSLVAHA